MSKRPDRLAFAVLPFVAILLVALAGCGGGGGSSSWSSSDVAKVEGELSNKLTESGLTPTKKETKCIVEGLEPLASASELFENKEPSKQQAEEIEEVTTNCLTESGVTASAEESVEEALEGLPACEEDPNSSSCIEEAAEEGLSRNYGQEAEEELESTESGEVEESGEENQGLRELDEELKQEEEEGQ